MIFDQNNARAVAEELEDAIQKVLSRHGLIAEKSWRYGVNSVDVKFRVMTEAPVRTADMFAFGTVLSCTNVTTEMLQRGHNVTNFEAVVNERSGHSYRVRITKTAKVKYQYTYLEGPNTGKTYTGPFHMFSALAKATV